MGKAGELVARLQALARPDNMDLGWREREAARKAATLLASQEAENEGLRKERDDFQRIADNLKLQAQCHSMEARGAKQSLHESYQAATGATGEPGNWHGAEPIKRLASERDDWQARALAAEARVAEEREACARICEQDADSETTSYGKWFAELIRARGDRQ